MMNFVRIAGLPGKVYVPEPRPGEARKHACPDCHCCQMCSEERCRTCRSHPEHTGTPDCKTPAT
jgi:hypothetical protein